MRLLSLERILQTQFVFGEELYDGLYEKSVTIIEGIIADHPLVDGNKRTAMLAGLTFLGAINIHFLVKKVRLKIIPLKLPLNIKLLMKSQVG